MPYNFDNRKKAILPSINVVFQYSEYKEPSREVVQILQGTVTGATVGMIYGGFMNSRYSAENFKKANNATLFENANDARRKLQTKVVMDYGKGGLPFGLKLGTFCFLFM